MQLDVFGYLIVILGAGALSVEIMRGIDRLEGHAKPRRSKRFPAK